MHLPPAILLDLDDTILDDSSNVPECWAQACASGAPDFGEPEHARLVETIRDTSRWFWSDADRHREGRLQLDAARREVVRLALERLGIDRAALAEAIGDAYSSLRDSGMQPLPDAIDTVRWLRQSGCALALLTNGAGPAQRKKIDRFGLADLFDVILVEGEAGFGKPDPRIYALALSRVGVDARSAWMVGDNLEWDVAAPQRLGVFAIWVDRRGAGIPAASPARPDRVVRALRDLRSAAEWTLDARRA